MSFSIKLLLAAMLATGCYGTVGYEGDVYGYNEYGDPIYYQDGSYLVLSNGYWYSHGPYGYVPYGHHHAYRQHYDGRHYEARHHGGQYYQHRSHDHRGYRR